MKNRQWNTQWKRIGWHWNIGQATSMIPTISADVFFIQYIIRLSAILTGPSCCNYKISNLVPYCSDVQPQGKKINPWRVFMIWRGFTCQNRTKFSVSERQTHKRGSRIFNCQQTGFLEIVHSSTVHLQLVVVWKGQHVQEVHQDSVCSFQEWSGCVYLWQGRGGRHQETYNRQALWDTPAYRAVLQGVWGEDCGEKYLLGQATKSYEEHNELLCLRMIDQHLHQQM